MSASKRTLLLSAGALSAALMLSVPVVVAEGNGARSTRGNDDQWVQAGGHRGHFRGPRSHYRGRFRGQYRDHYRPGYRHWRGHRYWYRHRPYQRGHHYWWNPRYGHGYGYGHLGYGTSFVIRIH